MSDTKAIISLTICAVLAVIGVFCLILAIKFESGETGCVAAICFVMAIGILAAYGFDYLIEVAGVAV